MRFVFLVLSLIVFVHHADLAGAKTTFQNGIISSGDSLSSGKPKSRDDLIIDLDSVDTSHLDETLTRRDAIRFEQRVGIGAPLDRFERYIGLTRRQAIAMVVDEFRSFKDPYRWPDWIDTSIPVAFLEEALRNNRSGCSLSLYRESLASEWSHQMLTSQTPQFDRQALLWLDHFSVAFDTYKRTHAFAEHLKVVRQHTNGNYVDFLKASLEDPGVIIYLNNETSTKKNPNENLAREFLELFSLGEGQYGEGEIRNLAKMLAGNGINFISEEFVSKATKRTTKTQKAFGQKYSSIDEFFEILVDHPYFGAFVAKKYFNEYVALGEPSPEELAILVTSFREADYAIPALFEATLSLASFWDEKNKLTLVKSPVDLLFGTARTLQSTSNAGNMSWLTRGMTDLNQDLFNPPNIAGWPTGREWVSGQMIEKRIRLMKKTFRDLEKAQPPKRLGGPSADQRYQDELTAFFDSAVEDQLAVELIAIDWIAEDFGKRRWNDFRLSFYNVRLNDRHYDGIKIEFGHDRNDRDEYGDFVRVREGYSSPDIFSSYKGGWMDDRDGAMTIKFSYPGSRKNKRFRGRSPHEKLLIKRLMQSFRILLDNTARHRDLFQSPGGIAWMEGMMDQVGFDDIETVTGAHPPVKNFAEMQTMSTMAKGFSCGAHRIGFNLRKEYRFDDNFFRFDEVKARAQAMDMDLSELLVPDLSLSISDDNYMDILTYEGYQLK